MGTRLRIVLLGMMSVYLAGQNACAADVLFDNGNHVQTGTLANSEYPGDPGFHNGDDFVLTNTSIITEIHWKGFPFATNGR